MNKSEDGKRGSVMYVRLIVCMCVCIWRNERRKLEK